MTGANSPLCMVFSLNDGNRDLTSTAPASSLRAGAVLPLAHLYAEPRFPSKMSERSRSGIAPPPTRTPPPLAPREDLRIRRRCSAGRGSSLDPILDCTHHGSPRILA